MSFAQIILWYTVALAVGTMLCVVLGRRWARSRMQGDAEGVRAGAGPVEAAAFGLYGLLVAFTFSGAAGRFDARRQLVVEEANAIGTAWLRLDLLPTEAQGPMRQQFRDYVDSRIKIYQLLPDLDAARAELARSNALQAEIWDASVKATSGSQPGTMLLLPALNQMIDLTSTRTAASQMHTPEIIFAMLFFMALGCALLVGFNMCTARRFNWVHALAFTLLTSITVYVVLDLEHPRLGLIRVDSIDQMLVDVRKGMK